MKKLIEKHETAIKMLEMIIHYQKVQERSIYNIDQYQMFPDTLKAKTHHYDIAVKCEKRLRERYKKLMTNETA